MSNKFKKGDIILIHSGKYKRKLAIITKYDIKNSKVFMGKKNTISKTLIYFYTHVSNVTHFNIVKSSFSKILLKNSLISLKSRFYKNSGHILNYLK